MNQRVNAFADLASPVFKPKPRKDERPVANETIDRIAEDNNFVSRQPAKTTKEPRRKRRQYTTGRNQQINIKAKNETIERFYKLADQRHVPLGELFEHALDALEGKRRAGAGGAE
jgi:hypothetical protein